MLDTYLVNGVDLRSYAWRIETAEGLQDAPDLRGGGITIPGGHGNLDVESDPTAQRRRYAAGEITFTMWLLGVDQFTGAAPAGDGLDTYFARLNELQRLFSARQLVIEHPRFDGLRRALAKLSAPLRPVREPSSPWFGRLTAKCQIPTAFWLGTTDVTAAASLGTGGVLPLGGFGGCDAPITDGVVRFGPGANPRLVQGGTFVGYNGVIPAGKELVIDCAAWKTTYGAGGSWATVDSQVEYNPGPFWFELDPTVPTPSAVLTHTGGGVMNVAFTARPKYLTS
jgi:hypothetical protein